MGIEGTLSKAWDQHLASEFAAKSAEEALATMTAEPYVNEVPLMIGAGAHRAARLLRQPLPEPDPAGHGDGYRLSDHRTGPGRRRADCSLHALDPPGLATARGTADRKTRGDAVRRHRSVRRRQGRARASVLGPGFGARPGWPSRSNASRSRQRDRGASAESHTADERTHPSRVEQKPMSRRNDGFHRRSSQDSLRALFSKVAVLI